MSKDYFFSFISHFSLHSFITFYSDWVVLVVVNSRDQKIVVFYFQRKIFIQPWLQTVHSAADGVLRTYERKVHAHCTPSQRDAGVSLHNV